MSDIHYVLQNPEASVYFGNSVPTGKKGSERESYDNKAYEYEEVRIGGTANDKNVQSEVKNSENKANGDDAYESINTSGNQKAYKNGFGNKGQVNQSFVSDELDGTDIGLVDTKRQKYVNVVNGDDAYESIHLSNKRETNSNAYQNKGGFESEEANVNDIKGEHYSSIDIQHESNETNEYDKIESTYHKKEPSENQSKESTKDISEMQDNASQGELRTQL